MNIFISYSTESKSLVSKIASQIGSIASIKYWDQDKVIGDKDWDQIFEWIDESDIVLALITDRTISRAMAVGQEIGHAQDAGKLILPIITKGVKESDLGCLKGIIYERIDPDNPGPALYAIEKRIKKIKRDDIIENLVIILAIVVLVWLSHKNRNHV